MKDIIYFDRFAEEIVSEKDDFAPPERYYEIRKGLDNETFVDRYALPDDKWLCYSYPIEKSWKVNAFEFNRHVCFLIKQYGAKPEDARLVSRDYPIPEFEKLKERLHGKD